jgi:hypothetical protein
MAKLNEKENEIRGNVAWFLQTRLKNKFKKQAAYPKYD